MNACDLTLLARFDWCSVQPWGVSSTNDAPFGILHPRPDAARNKRLVEHLVGTKIVS